MALPTQFSNNTAPTGPELDGCLLAVAAMGVISCAYSGGPNAIVLTPNSNQPDVNSYANLLKVSFVATATSTGSVTAEVDSLGFVKVFLAPSTQAGNGGIVVQTYYEMVFLQALDSGNGGWLISSSQDAPAVTILNSFIGGLALSNDGSTPNTTIDIAKGVCADSVAATYIPLGGFTKKISGAWTAGSGNNGMGTGLTATASTWYHTFACINNGAADVFFDTSASAAHAPTNTTAFRRIGSFKLDASVHILAFTQYGSGSTRFYLWNTSVLDVNGTSIGNGSRTLLTLASVPPGVKVRPIIRSDPGTNASYYMLTAPDETDAALNTANPYSAAPGFDMALGSGYISAIQRSDIYTNTSQQIGARGSAAAQTISVVTRGWIDDV